MYLSLFFYCPVTFVSLGPDFGKMGKVVFCVVVLCFVMRDRKGFRGWLPVTLVCKQGIGFWSNSLEIKKVFLISLSTFFGLFLDLLLLYNGVT